MIDDGCETFEGFGTCGEITNQPHQDETSAKWADALVDAVFNDPDCEQLQVTSIIFAIQEMGFPKAEQILKLEQQLDPKKEGLTVDKPTLRQVARQWLNLCDEGKEVDNSFEAQGNRTNIVHPNTKASSFHDVQLKKDDHYKHEISGLYSMLNASEEKVKSLQLDNDVLKKYVKNLQTALQKTEDHKVHAEESKATLEEFLLLEKSKRIEQVSALENKLSLAKDKLDIVAKDNEELSAKQIDDNRIIKDLRGELVVKFNELDNLVKENGILKSHLDQHSDRLKRAEKENFQLKNTNVELLEHAIEWKKTIQDLRLKNDVLRKTILAHSSQIKKGETGSNSNSDLGSDSSSIGEVSIFSPDCFSSPLASEKLSAELAESGVHELVAMDTTHRIPRPLKHASASSLVHVQKLMRKRKLFNVQELESLPDSKRSRSGDGEATSMVGLYQKEALPLERATSFAINLPINQKLLEALWHTLCIHPHLFGCVRDFATRQVSSDVNGTELYNKDLTSLFYEFCTAQQSNPFCGRQFLMVICEELPLQSNSISVQNSHLNEVGIELSNNSYVPQDNPHCTQTEEFKSNVHSEMPQAMPPAITGVISFQSDFTLYAHEILDSERATDVLLQHNFKSSVTKVQTSLPSSDPVNMPSLSAGNKTVANINCSDAAGTNGNIAINCTVLSHEFMENNPHTSELELIPRSSSPDQDNLMSPADREISKELGLEASGTLFCKKRTNSPDYNDEGTEDKLIDFEDFDVSCTLPEKDYSLFNNISELMNQSRPSASAQVTGSLPACSTVKDEVCVQAIGSGSSDESDGEFHSSQCLLKEPSFELYSDCYSELLDSSSSTNVETPDSTRHFGVDSQDVPLNEANRAGCLDKFVIRLRPSKKMSNQPVPYRHFKLMVKIFLFSCLLLIMLFFMYLVLSKAVLTDEEYQNVLLFLGGKYSQNKILY